MVPIGGALAGFASAALVPTYGWQVLFFIGGVAPVVFALAAIFGLPESIKFMTLHESHRAKMEALLKDIRPDFQMPPNPRFVIEDERQSAPSEIIDKLNKEINAALADPRIKARLADLGGTALTGSPADFGKLIVEETEKWGKVVKFAGVKAD